MGKIYKRGKVWYIDLRVEGRRIRKKVGSSKNLAELVLKDLEVQATRGEYGFERPDMALDELFSEYIEYSATNHAKSTTRRYKGVIKNFKIFLLLYYPNVTKISDLNVTIFEKFKAFRKTVDLRTVEIPKDFPYRIPLNALKGRSKTINFEVKTLRSMLNFAIKRGMCRDNPAKGVTSLKNHDSKPPRFLTFDETDRFLENCDEKSYPIFFTFLNTGLRLGELINLQWGDIDFRRRKLAVRKKEFWVPKAGEREVPLNDAMVVLLNKIKPSNIKNYDFVFPGEKGKPMKRKLRKDLIRIAKKAEIENFTAIHSLRHTFASHLVMKGIDLPTVQKLLGHADIQTTMIYSHLAPDHLADAVNKLTSG